MLGRVGLQIVELAFRVVAEDQFPAIRAHGTLDGRLAVYIFLRDVLEKNRLLPASAAGADLGNPAVALKPLWRRHAGGFEDRRHQVQAGDATGVSDAGG